MAIPATPEGAGANDDVFLCATPADYDALGSRTIIATLLRQQLEALAVTPSEILYGAFQLRQVIDQRELVEAALWRVATVQGKLPGQEPQARRAVLQTACDAVIRRARTAETVLAAVPKQRSAAAAYLAGRITDSVGLGPALARAAVARDLAGLASWPAKFEHLIGLIWQQTDEPLHQAVDELLGDILAFPAATREMMPQRATTGAVLERLLELVQGRLSPGAGPLDRLAMLVPLFKQNRLPATRAAVLDRVRRQLKSSEPLGSGQNPAEEAEALRPLIATLLTPTGVLGGLGMAEALTRRHARRFKETGVRGLRRALGEIAESLTDLPSCVHYLATLCGPDSNAALSDDAIASLEAACDRATALESLVVRSPEPAAAHTALSRCAAALTGSGLPPAARAQLAARLERLIDEHAASGALITCLQTLEPAGARQAWRLAELVTSGAISDPRALGAVRQHLSTLLRQPGFNAELMALKNGADGAAVDPQHFRSALDRLNQGADSQPAARSKPEPAAPDLSDMTVRQPSAAEMTVRQPSPAELAIRQPDLSDMTVMQPRPQGAAPPPAIKPKPSPPPAPPPPAAAHDSPTIASAPPPRPRPAEESLCPNCFVQKGANLQCPECAYLPGTTANSPVLLVPGTWLLGRYRTGKLLGQGGFGATYLGWDDRLQIRVAVKEYFPTNLVARQPKGSALVPFTPEHKQTFTKGITRFLDEARTLARLRDTREIVAVQDYFEDNGTAYLVMELLQGQTMKKYIADHGGKIDHKKALSILMPIMKALLSVHEHGMIHRDISPDNIFMPAGGGSKLLDFGAARETAGEKGGSLTVILKPGFAPPEQYFSDGRQGPWTDVYALAASIYCAITGKPPQDSPRRLQEDTMQPPSALGIAITPELERTLMTALALRRHDRYQSMRDMIAALGKAGA